MIQNKTQTPIKQFNAVNFRNKMTYNELEKTAVECLRSLNRLNDNVIDYILSFSTLNRCYKCDRTDLKTFLCSSPCCSGVMCSMCSKYQSFNRCKICRINDNEIKGGFQDPKARINANNLRLQKEILLKDYQTYELINYTIDEDDMRTYLDFEIHEEEHLLYEINSSIFDNAFDILPPEYGIRIYPQENSVNLINLIRNDLSEYNIGLLDCIFFNMIYNRGYDIDNIDDDIKGRYYLFYKVLLSNKTKYQELTTLKTIGNINTELYTLFKRVRKFIDIEYIQDQLKDNIYLYILDDLNITHLNNNNFSSRLYKDAIESLEIYDITELQAVGLETYEEEGQTNQPPPHQLIIMGLYKSIKIAIDDYFT